MLVRLTEPIAIVADGRFAVTPSGVVVGRSLKVLTPKSQGHYQTVSYQTRTPGGRPMIRHLYVHRLVAEGWVDNPYNLPEVNHKDGDKTNNSASNLEWVDRKGNAQHAVDKGLIWNTPKQGQQGFQRAS